MSRPTNFATQDPLIMLLGAMGSGGAGQAITEQEATGAAQMADPECEVLPVKVQAPSEAELQALGFVLGEADPTDPDPLFRPATLPPGWTRRRTEHNLHTDLVDAAGVKRGGIFYKASRHDRCAHMWVFTEAPEDGES